MSGGYAGNLCGTHTIKLEHEFLNQSTFGSFLGSFKVLVEVMSVFHKLTSSPLR